MSFPVDISQWGLLTRSNSAGFTPGANAVGAGIDNTGVANVDSALYNLLYLTKNVFLPPGTYLLSGVFEPPSNCKLEGITPTYTMDGSGGGAFSGGSILKSSGSAVIDVGGKQNVTLRNFGVWATNVAGNGVQGIGPTTQSIHCDGLITFAANHNYLFEQSNSDPNGATGGGHLIENGEMHGGPNGVAIKALNVVVRNMIAHDITSQAYVAVSDNINGNALYSRAQNVDFVDCVVGQRVAYGAHVYSRDTRSITNANGVLPAKNIRFVGGSYSGALQHGLMIGDEVTIETTVLPGSGAAGQTRLLTQDVLIDTEFSTNAWNGIRAVTCGSLRIRGSTGGNGTAGTVGGTNYTNNNISADTTGSLQQGGFAVQDMQISAELIVNGTAVGLEIQSLTIPASTATVNVSARAQVYKTANTGAFNITAVTGAKLGQEFWVQINDNFSTVQLAANTPQFVGIGTLVRYRCIDTSGTMLLIGAFEPLGKTEVNRAYNAAFSHNTTIGQQNQFVNVTGNITSITLFQPLVPLGRPGFTLRLVNSTGGAFTIGTWDVKYKWPAKQFPTGAPTSIPANSTLLVEWYWDSGSMVGKDSWVY
jgi:hypothetical protein